jgi:hypothetical protein|tara:strand:- start:70 stop:252 length:183 start_codon:yes stop_codon:yes gene_type:complete
MYNVKITLDITYDKNYEIEADNEEQARALAVELTKPECSPNLDDWESSMNEWNVAYVEEV